MVEQGFDDGGRLRYLVGEARKTVEKVGLQFSTLDRFVRPLRS